MNASLADGVAQGRSADAARLYAIVYISTAAHLPSMDELEHLRSRAHARNLELDVSGVLLYSDGAFMQYLEGPAAGLAKVYGFIKADALHFGVIDLLREPIREREFGAWSMALRAVGARGRSTLSEPDDLLMGPRDASVGPRSRARGLLIDFWSRGRTSVAPTLRDFSRQRARRVSGVLTEWP